MDNDWERVEEGDPENCEHPGCRLKKLEGARHCAAHGGNMANNSHKAKQLVNYRLGKWKFEKQLAEKSGSSNIKSLTEEIAILRQLIQEQLLSCDNEVDLILKSGPISDLITKVNTLVVNCNNIDKTLGNLIDREKVVAFAQTILAIIIPNIPENKATIINAEIELALRNL